MTRTIKDIGERTLLKMFEELIDPGDLPFNDDAVAFSLSEDLSLVINIDTFVAKTDAPPGMSPYQMGAKTTTMSVSDLGAKGVQPLFTLASGAFPSDFTIKKTIEIIKGIKDTTNNYGAKYLGGDTNEADDIILSVVSAGTANKNRLVKRNSAKIGDILLTTGYFGFTGAGFKVFLEQYKARDLQLEKFKEAVYNPKARLREGLLLAKYGKISSCIDSSDGLAWCLVEILQEKEQQGIIIDNIPIDDTVLEFAKENNLNANELALYAGEEFELVFTINPQHLDDFTSFMKKHGVKIFPLGKIIKNSTNKILLETESEIMEIQPKGWEHFKKR